MKKRLLVAAISVLLVLFNAIPVMAYSSNPDFPKKSVTLHNIKYKVVKGKTGLYLVYDDPFRENTIEEIKLYSFKAKNRNHISGEIGFVRKSRIYINVCINSRYRLYVYDANTDECTYRKIGASILAANKNYNYFIGAKRKTSKPTEMYVYKYSKGLGYVTFMKLGKYCAFPYGSDVLYFTKYRSNKSFAGCVIRYIEQRKDGSVADVPQCSFSKSYGSVKIIQYLGAGLVINHNGKRKCIIYYDD